VASFAGLECGSSFTVCCNTPFPRSLGLTRCSSPPSNAESESGSDILPPLEKVSPESGNSEKEEDNRSEGKEDRKSAGEEGGNSGESSVDSEGSGVESWGLFGLSGVRRDSV
jgi:hypothetical protein